MMGFDRKLTCCYGQPSSVSVVTESQEPCVTKLKGASPVVTKPFCRDNTILTSKDFHCTSVALHSTNSNCRLQQKVVIENFTH